MSFQILEKSISINKLTVRNGSCEEENHALYIDF